MLGEYPHTRDEELLTPRFAATHGLLAYTDRVNTPEFQRMFVEQWKPDLCLMATFGQMIPRSIFEVPRFGFYNFHHSDEVWPSYPGPDPIRDMVRDGKTHVVITMHEVTAVLDGGAAFARSHKIPLPPGANSVKVHRLTWPQMGPFIHRVVGTILEAGVEKSKGDSQFLHDVEVPYRVVSQWKYPGRIGALEQWPTVSLN